MPDGAIAVEIGDAQGHDVDAAALMGQVRLSMRAIAAHEPDPATVLTRTNELPGGPVLGVVPDTEYREETFTLDKDSALIMVTDGVVEGPGLTLEAGLERAGTLAGAALHDGLNTEETADRILDAAVAVDHADDVAVLVIQRT
ncbi:PP2C family protein-serine/threonine phosphatase [Streptomyces sp. PA03-6a]|nr:PP2C family protein-serine/threonine phosphatase [Streptomyces sp. PA03-6a]